MSGATDRCEVAIVGGGPAGAALAIRLARAGRDVVLFERQPAYRWHAGGVFSGPAAVRELALLGVDAVGLGVARPIPTMWLEVAGAPALALAFGHRTASDPSAVGFDRSALDPLLLDCARDAGADVRTGATARVVDPEHPTVSDSGRVLRADVLVGADGLRSSVARAAGVLGRTWLPSRVGLTFHVAASDTVRDGRLVAFSGGYCGMAPVPGGRLNVGIVLGERRVRADGAAAAVREVLASVAAPLAEAEPLDHIAGAAPLGQTVRARAGRSWLLVGDAAGFLDPFTGEGLHRALVSSRLAAEVIERRLSGSPGALADYDRSMTRRFLGKDVVTVLLQAFLARPWLLRYGVRRLASRADVRERLELVLADLAPASTVLDPRVMLRGLAP